MHEDLVSRLRAAGCVFAEDEAAQLLEAAAGDPDRLAELARRRMAGEPLEHLVGWVDFDGLRVRIAPGVFIPRRRTAWLVELAAAELDAVDGPAAGEQPPVLLDLGCGCGAIAAALTRRLPGLEVHAVDIDPVAVAVARENLPVAQVHVGDLDAPLPDRLRGRVAVLVANMPYVPSAARALMPGESRDHEPRWSTDGGPDGLDLIRRVARLAPTWLRPGGVLLVETGDDATGQDAAGAALLAEAGLLPEIHHDEERGATAVLGRRP